MPAEPVHKVLNGWGAAMGTAADVVRVSSVASVGPIVAAAGARGVLARGLGRAYGDAAQNAGGRVIDMVSLPPVVTLDTYRGEVTTGAGVSLDALMRTSPSGERSLPTFMARTITVTARSASTCGPSNSPSPIRAA
jgi:FAD/FMN-containing dehydrogenase